jgi:hypothetical protein
LNQLIGSAPRQRNEGMPASDFPTAIIVSM